MSVSCECVNNVNLSQNCITLFLTIVTNFSMIMDFHGKKPTVYYE